MTETDSQPTETAPAAPPAPAKPKYYIKAATYPTMPEIEEGIAIPPAQRNRPGKTGVSCSDVLKTLQVGQSFVWPGTESVPKNCAKTLKIVVAVRQIAINEDTKKPIYRVWRTE
jgi:hypothetical protein